MSTEVIDCLYVIQVEARHVRWALRTHMHGYQSCASLVGDGAAPPFALCVASAARCYCTRRVLPKCFYDIVRAHPARPIVGKAAWHRMARVSVTLQATRLVGSTYTATLNRSMKGAPADSTEYEVGTNCHEIQSRCLGVARVTS